MRREAQVKGKRLYILQEMNKVRDGSYYHHLYGTLNNFIEWLLEEREEFNLPE